MKGLFNLYLVVGGMPAAVDVYLRTNNIARVVTIQKGILDEYRKDASKYDQQNKLKIVKALEIVPEELNRRNKRFIVADLKQGSRYDREADTFLWLEEAGISLSVRAVTEPKVPLRLARRSNFFKLFLNDVGLLSALYMDGIQYRILSGETDVNFGAVYENFVAQELASKGFSLYYFNSEDRPAEVDFMIEKRRDVPPRRGEVRQKLQDTYVSGRFAGGVRLWSRTCTRHLECQCLNEFGWPHSLSSLLLPDVPGA